MNSIAEIKIIGLDERRPPIIGKELYVDLFFKLSAEPMPAWCDIFNAAVQKMTPPVKMDRESALFIETYVRDVKQIPAHFETIKQKIKECNSQYVENIHQQELADQVKSEAVSAPGQGGAQGVLNEILSQLDFED